MKLALSLFGILLLVTRAGALTNALEKWNCTACHALSEKQAAWILPNAAPRLAEEGSRVSPDWIRRFLMSPRETLPGATMPDLLRGDADQIDALTHYLVSLGQAKFRRVMPDTAAVARGEGLYHRIGCVACHAPLNGTAMPANSVPLPAMAEKWGFDGLRRFLLDPLASRPSGRMPAMHLTESEATDVAHYLLRGTKVPAVAELAFFRGRIRSLDDLDSAEIARTLPAGGLALEGQMRDRGGAWRLTAWLNIEQAGDFTFFLKATGAGRFSIDHQWLMGRESWRNERVDERHNLRLEPGRHELRLDYVHRGAKEPAVALELEGPGISRGSISASRLTSEREPAVETSPFVVEPAKAEKGRELYTSLGCAACHDAKVPVRTPPALATLNSGRGCLAEKPSPSVPDFHFDTASRAELVTALAALNNPALGDPSPQDRVTRTMASYRCTACHSRDGSGGVSEERGRFFTSNVDDLGDEGRLPPALDGVGDKLRRRWLNKVLAEGTDVRPYLNTRMPAFGAANVGHLAELFIALDRQGSVIVACDDIPDVQRDAGRRLVGTDGLSCIACHRFDRQPAHALQALDLLTTTERLNEDWFRRFLRDPNRFHPGTRMPALWPGGRSLMPAILGGDTDRQHAALWTYFSDGAQAKFPEGLSRQSMEIVVGGEAVVYRGKLWEAGFRAIATGYPGQLNAAFDAEEMRLALLWRGRFLNAGPHWDVQGMGQIRPLGTNVIVLPHGAPLAVLGGPDDPWPVGPGKAIGMKFGGYQIDALRRPTLLYGFGTLGIEDFVSPSAREGKAILHRTLKFSGAAPEGLHLRLAVGNCLPAGTNVWRINDALTVQVTSADPARVRGAEEKQELLVPIHTYEGKAQLEIDYAW